jgi:hypothetical protein
MDCKTRLIVFLLLISFGVKSQIINIESYRLKNDTSKFLGSISGSFLANKNQRTILQLGFNSNLEFNTSKHTIMFISIYNWVKTIDHGVTENFLNEGFQHIRYNYALTEKLKAEAFIQYQYNKVMNLKERDLFAGGIRYKLTNSNVKTYLGTSIMYEHDIIADSGTKINYIKSSNYVSCSAYIGKLRISNTTYFQFNLSNNKYRIYSVLESTINIYKKIYYNINFLVQYDNDIIYNVPFFIFSTNNRITVTF